MHMLCNALCCLSAGWVEAFYYDRTAVNTSFLQFIKEKETKKELTVL